MLKRAALLSVLTLFAALLGTTPALAAVNLMPSSGQVEFGEVDLHYGGNPQQSVSFSDMLPVGSIDVESVAIDGAEPASFQLASNSCSGAALEFGQTCSVEVSFHPGSSPGAHSATLELVTSEGPLEVPLSGSAVTGTLSASPDPLGFAAIPFTAPGSHNEGENTETEQLTIQNSTNASTQVQSASISGPDASSFSIQWDCNGDVLGNNNTCNMGIRFQPSSPGAKSASLTITSDSASSPLVVPLSGEGLNGPHMTINTTQALLGDVALGSSLEQTFTVANSGDYPLFIERSFLVSGTPLMFPVLGDSCSGAILYPSESCAITLAFRPTTTGEKSASLLFITNTPAINVAGIDGVGVDDAAEAALALAPAPSAHSSAHAAAAPPSQAPPASAPTPALSPAVVPPAPLSAQRAPSLSHLLGRTTLDLGADVQCPATASCETLAFIIPIASRSSARGVGHGPALLGSAVGQLRPGQGAHVHIPLSLQALRRLKQHGHMRVRVAVVVLSGATILAQHTWTVRLTGAGAVRAPARAPRARPPSPIVPQFASFQSPAGGQGLFRAPAPP